jgi:hypothetical protein
VRIRKKGRMMAKSAPALRAVEGCAQMRERVSDSDWFWVEFLVYYDQNHIRAFAYVRRKDGAEIPDGEYEVTDELGEHRRRWNKRDGKWQVRWRHRWSKHP